MQRKKNDFFYCPSNHFMLLFIFLLQGYKELWVGVFWIVVVWMDGWMDGWVILFDVL